METHIKQVTTQFYEGMEDAWAREKWVAVDGVSDQQGDSRYAVAAVTVELFRLFGATIDVFFGARGGTPLRAEWVDVLTAWCTVRSQSSTRR